jgi:hypothetical protein
MVRRRRRRRRRICMEKRIVWRRGRVNLSLVRIARI